jgi:hypothetical protein
MPRPAPRSSTAGRAGLRCPPAAALLAASLAAAGCVESSKSNQQNAARLAAYILDAPPAVPHKLDLNYEGKIRLLGYKIEPEGRLAPGTDVQLTLYWQCDERLDEGWQLFTHLLDERGVRLAAGNLDNTGPLRDTSSGTQALPPSSWKRGKIYVDEQRFALPADAAGELRLVTGIWKGDGRLRILGPGGDSEQRGLVTRIGVGATPRVVPPTPPRAAPPLLRAPRAGGPPPKIDGKLDDEIWRTAALTGPLVDVTSGAPNSTFPVNAAVRVAWDDAALYLAFEVQDTRLIGGFKPGERDAHLWEKECVEIMIDPDGDGDNRDYYELQISPQNLIFDSQFDEYNRPRGGPDGPFGHQEWAIQGQTAVAVDGTLDDDSDQDHGYTVEAAISWASFAKAQRSPPRPGDVWRMNFYGMKRNGGVSWSPILGEGNFHKASRFGRVMFLGPGGAIPAGSGSAGPAGSGPAGPAGSGPAGPAGSGPAGSGPGVVRPPPPPPRRLPRMG